MIPFLDLKAQYRSIKAELDAAVISVLESCQFALGPEVAAFEQEFASYCNMPHGVALNSGTSALHLAFIAAGIGPGDEVIVPSFTFVATAAAVVYAGARPVFADIDPASFTVAPASVEKAITSKTKAIVPVHLYGQPADMDPILEIARSRKLLVIEDSAQAHGAEYKGRRTGTMGDLACFSFYPGKNLGACGEGGMVLASNPEYVRKIRMLRDWGQEKKYYHELKGFNYRMEGVQGAALRVKLRHLEKWTEARRAHGHQYTQLLAGSGVTPPAEMDYARHVYHVYAVRSTRRDAMQQFLKEKEIQTGIHYPIPVHLLGAYKDLGYRKGDLPETEKAADEVLSLPMYPELTEEQIKFVADCVRAFGVSQ